MHLVFEQVFSLLIISLFDFPVFVQAIKGISPGGIPDTFQVILKKAVPIPAITSYEFINSTSVLVETRVPINMFDYEATGASIAVEGDATLNLAGSERKLRLADVDRKLQAGSGGDGLDVNEEAPFKVDINLQSDGSVQVDGVQDFNVAQIVQVRGFAFLAAVVSAAYAMW